MLEAKSFTPSKIAFLNSTVIGLSVFLLSLLSWKSTIVSIIGALVIFLLCFFLTKYLVDQFINRRVKLIYKFIRQTKASKREEFYNKNILPKQSLDEVTEDVLQWSDQRKNEIEILERNEQFRKEFLQNLSHEFKTPAFAIQGYLETLMGGAIDNPEVNRKFLGNAFNNTERLINLINDLDEITKLESGKQELHLQQFIIQDLIQEVFESLSFKTKSKNIIRTIVILTAKLYHQGM